MRTIVAIRHGQSTANLVSQSPQAMGTERLAFENRYATLTEKGEADTLALADVLPTTYGITPCIAAVAVSELWRTQQSAQFLGFREELTTPYSIINEVEHGMALDELRAMLRRNTIPPVATQTAEKVLENAPSEGVWVTHGLLVAGICMVVGVANQYERLVPLTCEVREIRF